MTKNTLTDLLNRPWARRRFLKMSASALAAMAMPAFANKEVNGSRQNLMGFEPVAVADLVDDVVVPKGYIAEVFYAWGDPISVGPDFKMDATNTAAEQAMQAGMHHDAIQFFPLPENMDGSKHGLLVMNHEYIDAQILHSDGGVFDSLETYTSEKTLKEQNAHGVSVIEVVNRGSNWQIQRPSQYARRITANTAIEIAGPAAGHALLQTPADPEGKQVLGTLNNCSNGKTPWGTYLTCEENFNDYFKLDDSAEFSGQQQQRWQRYDIKKSFYGWHLNDERFDVNQHPNECHRFGWIVEFDPLNSQSVPVKRTAMGRFSHENVAYKLAKDGRVAFYSGDDSKFEYLYKFVTEDAWDGTQGAHHGALLDQGTLYVARFDDEGHGQWLALVHGQGPLTVENGFIDQADVLVHARLAADAVGATALDRPEWVVTHPKTQDIYVSLTNNDKRGDGKHADVDAVNPRAENVLGHIIKLIEQDAADSTFRWDIFALAGDAQYQGTINGDDYANPDGMMIDQRGVLWVQTDVSSKSLNQGLFKSYGNNQMLAVDPTTGETRRFLTGPNGCEVTGVVLSPDMKTMWVNIQHPGEMKILPGKESIKKSPLHPNATSNWPDHQPDGRPRSATVMIRRRDGGLIGT